MGKIIVVDFRDNEDFENHPYMAYLKQAPPSRICSLLIINWKTLYAEESLDDAFAYHCRID